MGAWGCGQESEEHSHALVFMRFRCDKISNRSEISTAWSMLLRSHSQGLKFRAGGAIITKERVRSGEKVQTEDVTTKTT